MGMVKKYKGRMVAIAAMLLMLLTISWESPYLPVLFGVCAMVLYGMGNHLDMLSLHITERKLAEQALAAREQQLRTLIDAMPDFVCFKDREGRWMEVNRFGLQLFELENVPYQGKKNSELIEYSPYFREVLTYCEELDQQVWQVGGIIRSEEVIPQREGMARVFDVTRVPLYEAGNRPMGMVMIGRDITERKRSELKITHMSFHDVLTDLPNRRLFHDRLQRELSAAKEKGTSLAVMFIDLDNFKRINDTLGHVVGDMLLQEVVQVLKRALRPEDLIARLGGDEFAILLQAISREEAARLAENIISALSCPLYVQQHELFITTSIGICLFPEDGVDMDSLLRYADAAMYTAKEKGKNNFQFYIATNQSNIHRELEMEKHLRRALELGEFHLRYQPQWDLRTSRVIGLEALLRWRNPVLGDVSPAEFIPLAEASGLIVPIGEWVLQTACADLMKWQKAGLPPVHVSVNLSSRQFHRQDLCNIIADVLDKTGLHPQYLDLEITESMTMEVDAALSILNRLKQLGVQVSIDDFGTGYSSLSYLKSFPIDRIKIDQSFIREIKSDPKQAAIVSTIISMTKNLQLKAIAEGVETPEQLAYLEQLGCDEVQGFVFARPLPSEEIPAWLTSAIGRA